MLRLLFGIPLVGACLYLIVIGATDPLGATTREQIRSHAAVQIAQTQAAAQVQTTATWAGMLPILALIIVLGILASIVLYFRGKAYLAQQQGVPSLPLTEITDYDEAISIYAALINQRLIVHQGEYYLVDQATGKTLRARPKLPLTPD